MEALAEEHKEIVNKEIDDYRPYLVVYQKYKLLEEQALELKPDYFKQQRDLITKMGYLHIEVKFMTDTF